MQTHPGNRFYGCNLTSDQTDPKPAYHTFKLLVGRIGSHTTVETLTDGRNAAGVRLRTEMQVRGLPRR